MSDKLRPGQLAVWWHEGNRDEPMAMEVSGIMGAQSISRALKREPKRYHAIRVMKWDGFRWRALEGTSDEQ